MSSRNTRPLPPDAVASVIWPAWADRDALEQASPPRRTAPAPGSIGALVLAHRTLRRQGRILLLGVVAAAGLHALALGTLLGRDAPTETHEVKPQSLVLIEHEVSLDEPEPEPEPEPPPPPDDPPAPEPVQAKPATRSAEPSPAPAPPPPPAAAQAGQVVAAEGPAAPVDFTGFDITTGEGTRYAGGVTASSGTSKSAVTDPNAAGGGRPKTAAAAPVDAARPVRLPARNWTCPWPTQADALQIDEQVVVLRVVVTAEGRASSVEVLADPGRGFGRAAEKCARTARFEPARDRQGRPYGATSPPIRVTFTR